MSIDDAIRFNFELLDKIDLFPFINEREDPYDIMNAIEGAYEDHEFSEDVGAIVEGDILQGFIFNYISMEDFIEYLHSRYGTTFNSEIKYWVVNRGTDA